MSTIVTRAGKGSPLTNAEVDANVVNLNNDKLQHVVSGIASSATPTPAATDTQFNVTALAEDAVFSAPSGSPVHGWRLLIRVKDDGTVRTIAWNISYRAINVTLPTATVSGKTIYAGCVYNATDSKWDVVAVGIQDAASSLPTDTDVTLSANSDDLIATQRATKSYVDARVAEVAGTPPTGTYLISGGGVSWIGNLDFNVGAAAYVIQGTEYASPEDDVALAVADPTDPRIDVIVVNTSNVVAVITGTPSAAPEKPDVDPSTQLELTFVYVPAAATEPEISSDIVYREGSEWAATKSGASITLNSTNNPFAGTVDIEATNSPSGAWINFEHPTDFDPNDYNTLVFRIRSKATWVSTRSLALTFRLGNAQKGTTVTLKHGAYGFDSSLTSGYQQIVIPVTDFAAGGLLVEHLRMTVAGSGTNIGFYLDNVEFQSGVAAVSDSARMRWRGEYSAVVVYVVNDVVLYDNIQYVCIADGVDFQPDISTDNWQASTGAGGGVTDHGALTGLADNDHPQYLLSATYTAADVLGKLLTVDGTGSGLDADLLDGNSSAAFATASHSHAQADVTNLVSDLASKQPDIQFKDEGTNAGSSGGVTVVDFVGAGVSVSEAGGTLTVTIAGSGGGLADGDYGDITVGGTGTTLTIDNDAVTYAKIQNVSTNNKVLGRLTSGAGDIEEIGIGTASNEVAAGNHTHAQLHDAATVSDTDTIDMTLAGQQVSGVVRMQMSITSDASGVKLSGDASSPGNSKYYGTDGSGTKGYHAISGGSGSHTPTAVFGDANDPDSIEVGQVCYVRVPYSGTIVEWTLVADEAIICVVDVWKEAGALPTNADSITASAKPTLSSSSVGGSSSLTGWDTTVTAGDVFAFELESLTGSPTQITLTLEVA
jgi:hypothetical protein